MNVFLSYSTRDERDLALARYLARALQASAVEVFFSEEIAPGVSWEEHLVDALMEKCTHFLLIASAAALAADSYVIKEIELARSRRARDPGFVVLQLLTGRIEPPFPELQTARYHDDFSTQWKAIAHALGVGPRTMTDGAMVPKLCDRKRQDAQFQAQFNLAVRSRPGIPQLYVIQGESGHGHDSLIDRFVDQTLRPYALHLRGAHSAAVERKSVGWPVAIDGKQIFEALLAGLFGEISNAHRWEREQPLSPAEWRRLTDQRREAVLVVQHELSSTGWQRIHRKALLQYAGFWREVAAGRPKLQCVVFLNAIYETGERAAKDRSALQASIEALRRFSRDSLPIVTILEELPWITPDDVDEWFDRCAADYDAARREMRFRDLFGNENRRPMARVERTLRQVQQDLRSGELGGYA